MLSRNTRTRQHAQITAAALAIVGFEEDTHEFMTKAMPGTITDMRNGTVMLKRHVLKHVTEPEQRKSRATNAEVTFGDVFPP